MKVIKIGLFPTVINLYTDKEEMNSFIENIDNIEPVTREFGRAIEITRNGNYMYILYLDLERTERFEYQMSLISHEIIHLVDYICMSYGIDDIEFRGYLSGHITRKVVKYLKKKNLLTI